MDCKIDNFNLEQRMFYSKPYLEFDPFWIQIKIYQLKNQFTACYYHVMYRFSSESTLYSWLNVKELLAQNRCDIWTLSDSNETRGVARI